MEYDYRKLTREVYGSQFVFALVMCAAVFPMLPLQDRPDPLSSWFASTGMHSGGIAFVLALAYAAVTYLWLRKHLTSPPLVWFVFGAVIGIVPGLFYTLFRPELATLDPIASILLGGIASGLVLGGPAYLLLRYFRSRSHVA